MNKKAHYSKHNPMKQTINSGAMPKKVGRGKVSLAGEGSDAYAKNYGKPLQPGANTFKGY
jgi:hypothetical protein